MKKFLSNYTHQGKAMEAWEAMKVAVKKQRRKIKAKMLGTPEEAESR